MKPMTIRLTEDRHGVELRGSRRVRYVPETLTGTVVETMALREIVHGTPNAVASSNLRAPGDWPLPPKAPRYTHGPLVNDWDKHLDRFDD